MSMPAQKIRPAREQYDKMTDGFFKKRLQRKIKPQKEVLMEKTLAKYHQEQVRQEQAAQKELQETIQKELEAKAQKRKAELNKLQRNAGFMDEWLEKGLKEWRINILKKKQREKEDEKFQLRQAEMTLTMLQKTKQDAKDETYREIIDFEKRLPKKSPTRAVPVPEDAEIAEPSPASEAKTSPTLEKMTTAKSFGKYMQVGYNKEREQRRRKMLMDQGKMQRELEAKRREDDLVEKMNRLSRQEQELEYEAWRTSQCKAVIVENRKLREARYQKREDLDTEVAVIREEEALTGLRAQLERVVSIEQERAENYTVARKQFKRNANAIACQEFFDLVFDLADEAFKHQQTLDSAELDPRNWREWTQLFVDKLPMAANSPITYGTEKVKDQKLEIANARLDYLELLDYLGSRYQWARTQLGAEGAAKLINNFELGNAVRTLITLSYPPLPQPDRPKIPLDVKLKLSIIGYAYGGKKTQARLLASKHGISLISLEELIQAALKESEPLQLDDLPMAEDSKKAPAAAAKVEPDPALKQIGLEIREALIAGKEVSDLVAVKLIMHELRKKFGFTSRQDYYNSSKQNLSSVKPHEKISVEEAAAPAIIPPETTQPAAAEIKEENQEIRIEKNEQNEQQPEPEAEPAKVKGFILVDFPSTLNQAKLLEEALSGYICPEDKEIEIKEQLLSESAILAEPTPLAAPPKKLIPSGLDAVLWLKTTKTECIKRAFWLKKDVKNDTMYHVLYNPPPTSSNDIVEKLQTSADSELPNAMLTDRHIAFEMAISALAKWLRQFGDEKRARCLLQEIETPAQDPAKPLEGAAAESINSVHSMISEVVNKVMLANTEEEQAFVNKVAAEIDFERSVAAAKLDFEQRSMTYEDQLAHKIVELERKKAEEAAEAERAEKLAKEAKKEAKKDSKKEAKKAPPAAAEEAKKAAAEAEQKKVAPEEPKLEPPTVPEILAKLAEEKPKEVPAVQIEDSFKRISNNFFLSFAAAMVANTQKINSGPTRNVENRQQNIYRKCEEKHETYP